jgi:protein arginine kinase
MGDRIGIDKGDGWFSRAGREYDVVVSSRARLSRNLEGAPFPGTMGEAEELAVTSELFGAFKAMGIDYDLFMLDELAPIPRRILLERSLISQEYSLKTGKLMALRKDQLVSVTTNEVDHLRISSFRGGLELREGYRDAEKLDISLEERLNFAASLDLGYLTTELSNIGTGLRLSIMLHLPALVRTGLIDKALKVMMQLGFTAKGFFGADEYSLGDLYQVSNQIGIGASEEDTWRSLKARPCSWYSMRERRETSSLKGDGPNWRILYSAPTDTHELPDPPYARGYYRIVRA